MDIEKTTKCKCAILCSGIQNNNKKKKSPTLSFSLPCVTLVHRDEPGRVFRRIALWLFWWEASAWKGADHRLCALNIASWKEGGGVVKKKKICHCWMEVTLLRVVPVFLLQLGARFWHKKVRIYERKISATNGKKTKTL